MYSVVQKEIGLVLEGCAAQLHVAFKLDGLEAVVAPCAVAREGELGLRRIEGVIAGVRGAHALV